MNLSPHNAGAREPGSAKHTGDVVAPRDPARSPGRMDLHMSASNDYTDEQLLSDYRKGDRSAFTALVARYQRELYHFLVRFLGNRASAEDVFQETFLQVHQSAEQFDLQRRFRPWLFTIAANKARDLIRSQARRPTNPLQASINNNDDESGEFIDLMRVFAYIDLPDAPLQKSRASATCSGHGPDDAGASAGNSFTLLFSPVSVQADQRYSRHSAGNREIASPFGCGIFCRSMESGEQGWVLGVIVPNPTRCLCGLVRRT